MQTTMPIIRDTQGDKLKELIREKRQLWRTLIASAQTDYGMKGSVDGRYSHATFLRDSMIVAYDVFQTHVFQPDEMLFQLVKKSLLGITKVQLHSGKFVHEITDYDEGHNGYKSGHFKRYPKDKNKMYNEHTIDDPLALWVTPLFLNERELIKFIPTAKRALKWIIKNLDDNNGFLKFKYQFLTGGLTIHGWMDSWCSVQHDDPLLNTIDYIKDHAKGRIPPDPLALVEAQINTWKALRLWADILEDPKLKAHADKLKKKFNKEFIIRNQEGNIVMLAHAIDGVGNTVLIQSINQAFALLVSHGDELIIDLDDALEIARNLTSERFYDMRYGVRTFGYGHKIMGDNYHLGETGEVAVYWTMSTGIVEEGIENLSRVLFMHKRDDEARRAERMSGEIALTMLHLGLSDEIGSKEQFYVKNGKVEFFRHDNDWMLYANPKNHEYFTNPTAQTWTVSKLLNASYNPIIQREIMGEID